MRKTSIKVAECEIGMKVAETIFNEYGGIIIYENTILDNHLINKLKNLGIEKIKIYIENQENIIANSHEVFNIEYSENVNAIKDVLHNISVGKNIDVEQVNDVSDSIVERINENRDIVNSINHIRSVDEYTYTHSVNVSLLCMLIGKWLKFDQSRTRLLVQAGLLHDIGKGRIPLDILNKPASLTDEEFDQVKRHSILGYRALEKVDEISKEVAIAVLMHHEREDGSGYPMGIKGPQIHEFAKIIAVADIYDAMTSNRVYREKESPFEVFDLIENNTFGVLDHRIISTFMGNIASYYIGDLVKLNNNEIGEIVYINPTNISKPIVKVGDKFYDLTKEKELKIIELF